MQGFNRTLGEICRLGMSLALAVVLGGCAVSPYDAKPKAASDQILQAQVATARQSVAQGKGPRLIFAGFGFHDQSKAFRGDVDLVASRMRQLDPQAVVFKLANPALGQDADLPFATRENFKQVISEIAAMARPNDQIVLLFTSHGERDFLAISGGGQNFPAWRGAQLRDALAPLAGHDVGVIISACYSASLIPALRRPRWWIMTAAAADQHSFGCQFHGKQTYFVDALFGPGFSDKKTWSEVFADGKQRVEARERAEKLGSQSNPQFFVGPAAKTLVDKPVGSWFSSANSN